MNNIVLAQSDIDYILKWRDSHKDFVRNVKIPMKAVRISSYGDTYLTCIAENQYVTITINTYGISQGSVMIKRVKGGYEIVNNKTRYGQDMIMSAFTIYFSTMAFMVYGETQNHSKKLIARKENDNRYVDTPVSRKHTTYIMTNRSNIVKMPPKTHHASPKGTFAVRGHYRHYKSGKVVWISEFKKGTGNKRSQTFKFNKLEEN